jgi:PIN domain nuclease of toxin-antitoxin system
VRYLLDTHIAVAIANEGRHDLPPVVRALLDDPTNGFILSVASLWEAAIKVRIGKMALKMRLEELPAELAIAGIEFVDVRLFHTLTEVEPAPPTKDPFDRMLLAVAQVEQSPLVTLDKALRHHPLAWKPSTA